MRLIASIVFCFCMVKSYKDYPCTWLAIVTAYFAFLAAVMKADMYQAGLF